MTEEQRTLEELARRWGELSGWEMRQRSVSIRVTCTHCGTRAFLVELSRGVYRLADTEMSPYLDLVAVCRRCPGGSICMNSALSFWDLTDEVPAEVYLAVPRGAHRTRISYPPVRVHVFAARTFELGRERVRLESGEEIHVYSPERSVVDAVRLRGRVGTGIAYEALRRYLRSPGASAGELLRLARRLRAEGPMADALEVLTG
jgi:predicted transcriptional regulator of viral defense system